eukprot:6477549-Amphidinium_carterae.1
MIYSTVPFRSVLYLGSHSVQSAQGGMLKEGSCQLLSLFSGLSEQISAMVSSVRSTSFKPRVDSWRHIIANLALEPKSDKCSYLLESSLVEHPGGLVVLSMICSTETPSTDLHEGVEDTKPW